jgi:hypothetical protein
VLASEEEVMAMKTSVGGELGRRTDGGGAGHDSVRRRGAVPDTGEARVSVE